MYKIHILKFADWFADGAVLFDHGHLINKPDKICMVSFLIQGNGLNIMVDTGMDDIDQTYSESDKKQWDHLGKSRNIKDLLADHNLTCNDIHTILFTHLHFDHYWNVEQFKKSKLVANRKDWEFLMDPYNLPMIPPVGYPRKQLAYMAGEAFENLKLVNEFHEPFPGITMHWVGGHSPGHMVIKVETSVGPVIIVGDSIYFYENLEKMIPIGYYSNYKEMIDCMNWLKQQDAILLPAHDYKIFEKHPTLTLGE